MGYNIEYALSLGIEERSGLWKIQFIHPLDAMSKQTAWLPLSSTDGRIGSQIDGIQVATPGPRMEELLGWLNDKIIQYPYYWPYEGQFVDKYGYDFHVEMDTAQNNTVSNIEVSLIAYDILKNNLAIKDPSLASQDVGQETVLLPKGGAYVKYTVTLDRAKQVSEITISPFTEYELEVASIMYEEDIETFHPRKELVYHQIVQEVTDSGETVHRMFREDEDINTSTRTMQFKFPTVIARRFTFILRQKNYTKNTYLVRTKDVNTRELWNKISQREAQDALDIHNSMSTSENKDTESWTGWDIYSEQVRKHRDAHMKWRKEMKAYRERLELIKQKQKEQEEEDARYAKAKAEYDSALEKKGGI